MKWSDIVKRSALRALAALAVLCGSAVAIAAEDPLQAMLAGEFAAQSGDPASAARHYLAAAMVSGDPVLAERAARIALHAGDKVTASRALARWRQLAPDSPALHQASATLALAGPDRAAALAAFRRLLAAPGDEGWQRALQALASHDDTTESTALLGQLVAADALPENPDAWFAFGGLAARMDQDGLSGQLAEAAARRFPKAPRVWLWQAQRQRLAERPDAARKAIEQALELGGSEPGIRLAAAAELDALGDSGAAAAVLAEGPQDADTLLGRVAYLARAERTDALEALYAELAAGAETADDERLFLLGQVAELLKRPAQALQWYERVAGPEKRSEAVLRQAVVLEESDRLDEALARLRELQASDGDDGESIRNAYLLEAELLLRRERAQDAVAAYDRGLGIFEDDPQLLYARALALAELERIGEAEQDLTRLISMDPSNADALNALGYTLADRTDRLQEAREYIQRAYALAPDSAAIIDSLGWVLYRMGEAEAALVHLRRAFELQPDPEIAAHLGEALWVTGAAAEARSVWQQGAELDPDNALLRRTMERLDR